MSKKNNTFGNKPRISKKPCINNNSSLNNQKIWFLNASLDISLADIINKRLSSNSDNNNISKSSKNILEKELSEIWKQVLRLDYIKITDNFFRMGGHSLLAFNITSRIRDKYKIELPFGVVFENPTVQKLSKVLQSSLNKKTSALAPVIARVIKKDKISLSFAQQSIWFLSELLPNLSLYNISMIYQLNGFLNIGALRKSFKKIINRHEVLRTRFGNTDGVPYQFISNGAEVVVEEMDLSGRNILKKEIDKYVLEERNKNFDLNKAPLIRVKLLKILEQEHIMIITTHHIISDGWSIDILLNELSVLYNGYCNGKDIELEPLNVQYSDYALWQLKYLTKKRLEKQLLYWKKQLEGIPELINLPTDRTRPKELTYNGKDYKFKLSRKQKDRLVELCSKEQVSLFMAILSIFKILLYKYCRQEDIVIGSPIVNRSYKETEKLIGLFVNSLILRSKISAQETFYEVLKQVKRLTLEGYENQDVPFEQIVDHLKIPRSLDRNPIFQVRFVFQNAGENELSLQNLNIKHLDSRHILSKFDLSFIAKENNDGIDLKFEYATDLFNRGTIERISKHYKKILNQLIKNPNQKLKTINILTIKEEKKILTKWNDTKVENYLNSKTIHGIFEQKARQTPDKIAIICENQHITYKQLNIKANQLAYYLTKLGVVKETLVGIALERSLEMVVGILSILKVGGGYVPLDSNNPAERLLYILNDSSVSILLTQLKLNKKFCLYSGRLVNLDKLPEINKEKKINPSRNVISDNLAYVTYTSGSTGKPKGVILQHKGLVNYVCFIDKNLVHNVENLGFINSLSTDLGYTTLFYGLLFGKAIVIIKNDLEFNVINTLREFYKNQVVTLKLTPSYFNVLAQELTTCHFKYKKHFKKIFFILGGEALYLKKKYMILNHYGPTESTVGVSTYYTHSKNLHKKYLTKSGTIPIGKPINNTHIYILDNNLQPLPIGAVGDIYISGPGLARGYLNRADLTAERFIANPFGTLKDADQRKNLRLYFSGDSGRYLPDGNIEFIGRSDDQIKINGYRIELKEVEKVLNNHGDISQCLITTMFNKVGEKKLIAYVVSKEFKISENELREYLLIFLPEYMIPSYFLILDKIPLTTSGKIDKALLPQPEEIKRIDNIAPRNILEKELTELWKEILNLDVIGINDNFFTIGGDSIMSIRLISKARVKGIKLTIKDIFNNPTIELLSKYIKSNSKNLYINPILTIRAEGNKTPLFIIHPGTGLAFSYLNLPSYLDRNIPIYGINNPKFDSNKPFDSIGEIAKNYITHIKKLQQKGPYLIAGWSFGGIIAIEICQQLINQGEIIEKVIVIDANISNIDKHLLLEDLNQFPLAKNYNIPCNIIRYIDDTTLNQLFLRNIEHARILLSRYYFKSCNANIVLLKAIESNFINLQEFKKLCKSGKIIEIPGSHHSLFDKDYIKCTTDGITKALLI